MHFKQLSRAWKIRLISAEIGSTKAYKLSICRHVLDLRGSREQARNSEHVELVRHVRCSLIN